MSTADQLNGRYTPIQWLDAGSSAQIFLAIDQMTSKHCVLKQISKNGADPKWEERIRREIKVMSILNFPFIVKYYDSFEDASAFYIVMEYCTGGDLGTRVMSENGLSEETAICYLTQLAFALDYLHNQRNVIHRDIKPENILLDRSGRIKLTDFGFSTLTEVHEVQKRTMCGSPAYASPELIQHEPYSATCDVWSAGVVFYVMLTGKLPFEGPTIQDCVRAVLDGKLEVPPRLSFETADLLTKMLTRDSNERIDIRGVLAHPAITKGRYFRVLEGYVKSGSEWGSSDMSPLTRTHQRGLNWPYLVGKTGQTGAATPVKILQPSKSEFHRPVGVVLAKARVARATVPISLLKQDSVNGQTLGRGKIKPSATFKRLLDFRP